jgi:phosphoglycolate phosphatase
VPTPRQSGPAPPAVAPALPYPVVIFDFDGTLADSIGWFRGVLNDVARRYRFRTVSEAEFELLRGCDSRTILAHLGVPGWKLPLIARHMRRRAAEASADISLFPGVPDMLDDLAAAGIALAVVSSNDEANVRRILGPAAAPVRRFLCGTGLFGKAAAFRRIRRHSGLPSASILAVGDEVRDIETARRTGLHAGAVTWGYATPARLAASRPDLTFRSVAEIAPALTGAGAAAGH